MSLEKIKDVDPGTYICVKAVFQVYIKSSSKKDIVQSVQHTQVDQGIQKCSEGP